MAKWSVRFVCRSCGGVQPRWAGRCPDCGEWDSLEEHRVAAGADQDKTTGWRGGDAAAPPQAAPLPEVGEQEAVRRVPTGIAEFDRVLGGGDDAKDTGRDDPAAGLVPGSAVLVGGDPGIGKSTLLLQAAIEMARRGERVLYVTSEESAHQLRRRALRLTREGEDADAAEPESLLVLADTNLARILEQARQTRPTVFVVDSIQMVYKGDLPSAPGTVAQLRSCCLELIAHAKATGCGLFLVGHVTKEGSLAGPRLLEHMVDAVLYFEGDRYHAHRVVRSIKNRFGTTLEVGLFEMTDRGLLPVDAGRGLLADAYEPRPGSVVCPVLQGSRCLLVELQALTATGFLGAAKRKVSGLDSARLAMLIAVLEKHGGQKLADQDVFASSVGGMKVAEPAADLAVALAVCGAHRNQTLPARHAAVGEIGLGGELRSVSQLDRRLIELARLGFDKVLAPPSRVKPPAGVELVSCKTLGDAMEALD